MTQDREHRSEIVILRVTPSEKAELRSLAKRLKISMAEIVRSALGAQHWIFSPDAADSQAEGGLTTPAGNATMK